MAMPTRSMSTNPTSRVPAMAPAVLDAYSAAKRDPTAVVAPRDDFSTSGSEAPISAVGKRSTPHAATNRVAVIAPGDPVSHG
jgi:hypothetical protein